MPSLVWFRSDLRVRDNPALTEACRQADDGVVGVFAICEEQWAEHDWGATKVDFVLRSVRALAEALARLRIPLRIIRTPRFDRCAGKLVRLARELGCSAVFFNREYEVNELGRDAAAKRALEDAGCRVVEFDDQVILPPTAVRTGAGEVYTVFSPYRRKWIATYLESGGVRLLPVPPRQRALKVASDPVPQPKRRFPGAIHPDLWKEGEEVARRRLAVFVEEHLDAYDEGRDFPALSGTSNLSPYLAAGVLSPRQCLLAALEANRDRLDSGSKGVLTWISELVWREFYRQILLGYPRVCRGQPFDLVTRAIRWSDDEDHFARWREGRTGFPLVDAAMRQLAHTGWMHNRLRMVSAMFLTKNLLIDWRWGERYFMQSLVDGDFASNNGGWQWSASTGTDAVPYFRVFNPIRQSERYDPQGVFLRKLLPELKDLDGKAIHMPAERAPERLDKVDYPPPIVDGKRSRDAAIRAFQAIKKR